MKNSKNKKKIFLGKFFFEKNFQKINIFFENNNNNNKKILKAKLKKSWMKLNEKFVKNHLY